MAKAQGSKSADRHILSRFDADLGHFRGLVLEMGRRVIDQVTRASEAFSAFDAAQARKVLGDHACGIARNVVYSVTGKDKRHVNAASLAS